LHFVLLIMSFTIVLNAQAQNSKDAWTSFAEATGVFSPHVDHCDSTEVFVTLGSGVLGYCIEKEEREAAIWVEAKQDCAEDGKRLPEPADFQYACKNPPTGLTDMNDDWEWASNTPFVKIYEGGLQALDAIVMGSGTCINGSVGVFAQTGAGGFEQSFVYRCVR
jgi:hypothetical protein